MRPEPRSRLPDAEDRDRIVMELDQSMLVEAAAGTGKTSSLVNRMVALLATGRCTIGTLAAVTFTRKAAAEIRQRFQAALEERLEPSKGKVAARVEAALRHQQRCFIGTIHAFCARLIRERPIEAGVELDFREIDEAEDAELRLRAWRRYINELLALDAPVVEELERLGLRLGRSVTRRRRVVDDLEELGLELPQLGAAFLEMARFPDVEDWGAADRPMPDLTPVRRELAEYLNHVEVSGISQLVPGTCRLIPKLQRLALASRHVDAGTPAGLMRLLEQFEGADPKPTQKQWSSDRAVAKQWTTDELARWADFRDRLALPHLQAWREHRYVKVLDVLRPAMDVYDSLRGELNVLNFQDLLLKARALLLQPRVRGYFSRRVTHLLVDEFQDTDPLQAELMMLLTADNLRQNDWRRCRPRPGSLFIVGDPKQSIYRFRRADMEVYFAVRQQLINSGAASVVQLSTNFRSQPSMVAWINGAFAPVFPAELTRHQAAWRPLQPHGEDESPRKDVVERSEVDDNLREVQAAYSEAQWIAGRIQQLMRDDPTLAPSDFLLLTWTRRRLGIYSAALEQAGIRHQVTGGSELSQSAELRLLRGLMRAVARPADPLALLAVLRGELFGVSDAALFAWRQAGGKLSADLGAAEAISDNSLSAALKRLSGYCRWFASLPLAVAVERIAEDAGLAARAAAAGSARAGAFGKAIELLRKGASDGSATDVLERLDALVSDQERRDGVVGLATIERPMRVMNLHQAKGLEARVVFLADPSGPEPKPVRLHIDRGARDDSGGAAPRGYLAVYSGLRPAEKWRDNPKLLACPPGWEVLAAEEQQFLDAERERLLYVAATRAKELLVCCPRNRCNNPWAFFGDEFPEQSHRGVREQLERRTATPPGDLPTEAPGDLIVEKWSHGLEPTYNVSPLKTWALSGRAAPRAAARDLNGQAVPADASEQESSREGVQWGSAVHTVLDTCMRQPEADLQELAIAALEQEQLEPSLARELVELVRGVRKAEVWRRAQAAPRCCTEAPISLVLPDSLLLSPQNKPILAHGVVDLAFWDEVKNGWVIVDYKSDSIDPTGPAELADYYRPQVDAYAACWERLSGDPVVERGLLFTAILQYVSW
ncbi:MAG: UvrD-helicase domain-containing protein [Planctomycetales bacterium]|nr:UvrD-helicase domain-containing protein [Planctomycetales bacterium]